MTVLQFDTIDDLRRNIGAAKNFGADLTPVVDKMKSIKAVRGSIEFDELVDGVVETTRIQFGSAAAK